MFAPTLQGTVKTVPCGFAQMLYNFLKFLAIAWRMRYNIKKNTERIRHYENHRHSKSEKDALV